MIGDFNDIFVRLKAKLPTRWFGGVSDSMPLLDGVLSGIATLLSFVYTIYGYAKLQTRIMTATDGWLDMIAADFFGPTGLLRKVGQSDTSYRLVILANLFREKATRNAIVSILTALTGRSPTIIEPLRPADTGAYGAPNIGYGVAGAYGSMLLPYQAFVIAYRPVSNVGIANVAGYRIPTGAYGTPSRAEYASIGMVTGGVTDADIFAAIDAVKPAGTIVWTRISN
ncbi:MAG: hypothetical protein GAK28_00112 [Luteibacter sp.]|uniref:hypothetical protein n=1 Tax=Luteibacter sp. TaxID=1886636 RepID=UPI00138061AE|nr:hypothetical protein [Luteibacter sp.]KAF1009474.1 MAG: hypothetical protein GAK28_00112 [Luteibacter sp.]